MSSQQILQEKYKVELDPEYTTVCDKKAEAWSDDWTECMIRVHTDPQNHQLATCAIGKVIDPQLRVYNLTSKFLIISIWPSFFLLRCNSLKTLKKYSF